MTDETFDFEAPDEEVELGALAQSLRLAKSFSLLFVRCNQASQRRRLIADVKRRVPELADRIQQIHFDAPIPHLLDYLRRSSRRPDAERGIRNRTRKRSDRGRQCGPKTPFVANLNAARDVVSERGILPARSGLNTLRPRLRMARRISSPYDRRRIFLATRPEEAATLAENMLARWVGSRQPHSRRKVGARWHSFASP